MGQRTHVLCILISFTLLINNPQQQQQQKYHKIPPFRQFLPRTSVLPSCPPHLQSRLSASVSAQTQVGPKCLPLPLPSQEVIFHSGHLVPIPSLPFRTNSHVKLLLGFPIPLRKAGNSGPHRSQVTSSTLTSHPFPYSHGSWVDVFPQRPCGYPLWNAALSILYLENECSPMPIFKASCQ